MKNSACSGDDKTLEPCELKTSASKADIARLESENKHLREENCKLKIKVETSTEQVCTPSKSKNLPKLIQDPMNYPTIPEMSKSMNYTLPSLI